MQHFVFWQELKQLQREIIVQSGNYKYSTRKHLYIEYMYGVASQLNK
jgi:hypothetical protein